MFSLWYAFKKCAWYIRTNMLQLEGALEITEFFIFFVDRETNRAKKSGAMTSGTSPDCSILLKVGCELRSFFVGPRALFSTQGNLTYLCS